MVVQVVGKDKDRLRGNDFAVAHASLMAVVHLDFGYSLDRQMHQVEQW
jgi:hypothetical protein